MQKLHFLNTSQNFTDTHIASIKDATHSAIKEIELHLPHINLDIVFMHAPQATISGEYIGGRTTDASTVFIYLDCKHNHLETVIQNEIKKTLAHEYHHACRWKSVGYGKTLSEALVTEGLADYFSTEIFNTKIPKWCCALNIEDMKHYHTKAQKEYNATTYNHPAWFFGTNSNIPKWAGYSLGYKIISDYLKKHPQSTAAKLVDTTASNILL